MGIIADLQIPTYISSLLKKSLPILHGLFSCSLSDDSLNVLHAITFLHVFKPVEDAVIYMELVSAIGDTVDGLCLLRPSCFILLAKVAAVPVETLDEGVCARVYGAEPDRGAEDESSHRL